MSREHGCEQNRETRSRQGLAWRSLPPSTPVSDWNLRALVRAVFSCRAGRSRTQTPICAHPSGSPKCSLDPSLAPEPHATAPVPRPDAKPSLFFLLLALSHDWRRPQVPVSQAKPGPNLRSHIQEMPSGGPRQNRGPCPCGRSS